VGTQLGLVPSLPILGAIPASNVACGFVGILVPIAAGFAAALIIRPKLVQMLGGLSQLRWITITVLGIGVVGGIVMGFLAWASGGAAGPGRLVDVGPNFWLTGLVAAAEFAVAAALGMLAGSRPRERR
jgi:hypothetical protein